MLANTFKKNGVWIALVLTIAACVWVSEQEEDGDSAGHNKEAQQTQALPKMKSLSMHQHASEPVLATQRTPVALTHRGQIIREPLNLFPSTSPALPVDEADHLVVENASSAPPVLPFTHAGKLIEAGQYMVFLIQGERNLVARAGDVIDKVWLVESIRPPQMIFVYLPLKTKLSLDIGESN